ncbi:MAG: hypothetical protein ACLTTP_03380 [Alistipes ihumii]
MKRLIVAVLLLTAALTCRAAEVGSLRCEYLADRWESMRRVPG